MDQRVPDLNDPRSLLGLRFQNRQTGAYYWVVEDNGCFWWQYENGTRMKWGTSQQSTTAFSPSSNPQLSSPSNLIKPARDIPAKLLPGGDIETLDPSYKKRDNPKHFFRIGKVFSVLWPEPAADASRSISMGLFSEAIYHKIRRFVVVREGTGSCTAIPITTYGGRGTSKKGFVKFEHAIIYTAKKGQPMPEPQPQELPGPGELGMLRPIRVDPFTSNEGLDPLSRVNFANVYKIEHYIKVKGFGYCTEPDVLEAQFHAVWDPQRRARTSQASTPLQTRRFTATRASSVANQSSHVQIPATVGPSDSGYSSMPTIPAKDDNTEWDETDRKTVVSEANTVAVDGHARVEAIDIFVGDLHHEISQAGICAHSLPKVEMTAELLDAVKCFAATLRLTARPGLETNASSFFRQQRRRIVSGILAKLNYDLAGDRSADEETEVDDQSSISTQEPVEQLEDKLRRMFGSDDVQEDDWAALHDKQMQRLSTAEETDVDTTERANPYAQARSFVHKSFAYKWLVGRLRKIINLTSSTSAIGEYLMEALDCSEAKTTVIFKVHWSPKKFLSEQYTQGMSQQLGDVIALTENNGNFQATTCKQYLEQTWPCSGLKTLSALQSAINAAMEFDRYDISEGFATLHETGDMLNVMVDTAGLVAVEIGEQLGWLGAACRASSTPDHRSYFVPAITKSNQGHFVVTFSEHTPIDLQHTAQDRSNCWIELFRNPGIAMGFPIPSREGHQGCLEIPLNVMAGLGNAERATVFDEQLLLKGFSTLFVPVEQTASTIKWHFVGNRDHSQICYTKAFDDQVFPSRTAVDIACLSQSRHFVGWVSKALLRTGASNIDYSKIRYPKARFVGPGCALEKVTISGGQFVTGGVSFTKGNKDETLCISYDGPLKQELNALKKSYVVLFDEQEKRGWLVDGASAVLHLLRAQLETEPFRDNGHLRINDFKYSSKEDGPSAACETLLLNKSLIVDEDEVYSREITWSGPGESKRKDKANTKIWTVEHLTRQLTHFLGQIQSQQHKVKQIHLRGTTREKLEGWSAKDMIEGEKRLQPRVVTLSSSGRGWVDFTRSIGAVTLIGRGFGELIQPLQSCSHWKRVPTGKDYLATTIYVLRQICDKYGDEDSSPLRLANETYWHQAHNLFESCRCSGSGGVPACDRVQVLLPRIRLGPTKRPDHFLEAAHAEGAVIFGRSERLKIWWNRDGDPVEGEGSSDGEDSGIGASLNSSSM